MASEVITPKPEVLLDLDELELVYQLAKERFENPKRKHSPTRHNARSIDSQYRGALGEYAAAKWVRQSLGQSSIREGFLGDKPSASDLTIANFKLEVMTALREHRLKYGYCVPPGKLQAAKNRGSLGYLFVTVNDRSVRDRATIDWYCEVNNVSNTPSIMQETGIRNYVCQPRDLVHPEELLEQLSRRI